MRCLFGFLCVGALCVVALDGCHEGPIYCETDADCPEADGNECTIPHCGLEICNELWVADGATCTDGACLDGKCAALTTVGGTVTLIDIDTETPAADAEVSWFGTSFSTTTNESGGFSLELPVGIVVLQTSKDGAWSGVELGTVSETGLVNPNIEIVADALVAQVAGDVMRDIDETKGIVSVYFEPASGVLGGETVLWRNPYPDPYDFGFTSDAGGNWVISDEILAGGSRTLSFAGVRQSSQLVVNPQGVEGVNTCRPVVENPTVIGIDIPVLAKCVTSIQALCTPTP